MKGFLFAILATFSLSVCAAPTPVADSSDWEIVDPAVVQAHFNTSAATHIEKREVGGMYICQDEFWQGLCGYKVQPLNECISLTDPWWHTISSFGPDFGTACFWYGDSDCQDRLTNTGPITWPGVDDMNHENMCSNAKRGEGEVLDKRCWGDKVGSWVCWEQW